MKLKTKCLFLKVIIFILLFVLLHLDKIKKAIQWLIIVIK